MTEKPLYDEISTLTRDEVDDLTEWVKIINTRFTYHPPKGDQVVHYRALRDSAHDLALEYLARCPDSRERSLALTKLEESIFWANAAIAREGE